MSFHISAQKLQDSETLAPDENTSRWKIATAYDAVAANYDSQVEPAKWVRERLWERMDILFPANSHVLDVTAGTGLDVLHLMERNVLVVACDISRAMLGQLHKKNPLAQSVVADFNQIGINTQFDGIISTFAGLNTTANLQPFAACAAQLLRPGGILFIHMLNRWPLVSIARQLIKMRWLSLWRSLATNALRSDVGDIPVPHYLYLPRFLYYSVFESFFHLSRIEGYGIIRPIDRQRRAQFEKLEKWLANRSPFYSFGVFFSLELIRRDERTLFKVGTPGSCH